MKTTQALRAEVQAMGDNKRRALEVKSAEAEAARAGMAEKSAELLEGGGKLYVEAAE